MGHENRSWREVAAAVVAAMAAAGGVGVAAAIPSEGSPSTGTVEVSTLDSASTVGIRTIVQAPDEIGGDLIVREDSSSDDYVNRLGPDGSVTTVPISGNVPNTDVANPPVAVATDAAVYIDGTDLLDAWTGSSSSISSSIVGDTYGVQQRAITAGPDSRLYITDGAGHIDACNPTLSGSGACAGYAVPSAFGGSGGSPGQPEGVVSEGGALWFTDSSGDLGSTTTAGVFSGVYDAGEFSAASSGIAAVGQDLWLIASDGRTIDEVASSDPTAIIPHPVTGSATPQITSVATGPDGNVWFTDTANDAIGFVDVTSGVVTEYPLPSGAAPYGWIAPGPEGTDTLVFAVVTGGSAINRLGQIQSPDAPTTPMTTSTTTTSSTSITEPASTSTTTPPPVPTTTTTATTTTPTVPAPSDLKSVLGLAGSATTKGDVASVSLACGNADTPCTGTLTLSISAPTHGQVQLQVSRPHRRRSIRIGRSRYDLAPGQKKKIKVRISHAGLRRLRAAPRGRLTVTATAKATAGRGFSRGLLLRAPTRPRR